MATLQDILSGNFPAAQRYAEGYAQMPSYLQDPYLGLSTSNIGEVTKGLLGIQTLEEFAKLAEQGKINIAKNTKQEIGGLLSGKSKFAELPNLDWDNPKTYDLVDPLIAKGFKAKTIEQGPDTVTLLYKNPKDIKLLETAKNPYEYGKAYGYSDADIAHFYNRQFGDNGFNMLSEAMGKKPYTNKTEFELAQELASKNAESLLGLPKGNTAMERAKAMGYDTPAYHGTNVQFSEFGPNSWFTTEPKYASQYANVLQPNGMAEAPQVIPTLLNLGKTKEAQMFTTTDDVMKALGKKNTDSFTLNNVGGGNSSHYVIKDPANVRSQFAAFDPARANEPDLLAAAMAFPISGLLEQPKDKKKKK